MYGPTDKEWRAFGQVVLVLLLLAFVAVFALGAWVF